MNVNESENVSVKRIVLIPGLLLVACALLAARQQPQIIRSEHFQRDLTPFPVLDELGKPYALPFLGGLNVPRPQFADIDGDGDLDLFVHELSSALWFFENVGTARAPNFVWRSDRFHDLDIGEWNKLVDIDADGDFDILGELRFSYVRLFRNTGNAQQAAFTADADSLRDAQGQALFADRQNIPALVDLDCNGRLDLFLGRVDGTVARYEAASRGATRFNFLTERFEGIEIIGVIDSTGTMHGANTMAFADADGDRDLDLYWGDFFERGVLFIENRSTACGLPALRTEPRQLPGADSTHTSGFNVPVLADLDSDGDLDFFMGVLGGAFNPTKSGADNFYYWERTAPDRLMLRSKRFLNGIDAGSESTPALGDLDGDGDQDILLGSKIDAQLGTSARLQLFRNEGTRTQPAYRLDQTLELVSAYHQAPTLGDLDGDGDLDLLLGTWNQGVLFFRNDGNARAPRFVADTTLTIHPA
ncbi:MAG: FG-GAP-like repeat-containing protein, partial [Longimicrobiales bacterium]